MSNKYVSPSNLQHYDGKIKDYIEDKISQSGDNITVDSALSSTSTNPVQNKVINTALGEKVPATRKINNKELSSDITLSASDVGADASGSASQALTSAKTYTDNKIDAIVGEGASTTLDTIGEISKAIEEHQDVTDALNAAIGNKVDKVSGKGLSTNDLTSTLKTNYDAAYTHSQAAHAPSIAEKNVIVGVQKNGTDLTVDSTTRKVNITVPTKVSELTNDSGFKTTDTVTTVTTTGSGNAITALSATNGAITATKGSTFLTAHPTISKSTDTTSTATATHGGTITMVDSVTRDSNGHVTKVNTKTVTLPTDNNTVYTHPTYTSKSSGLYKVTVDGTGHVSGTAAVAKSDITALGIPAQDTTYSTFVKSGSSAKAGLVPAPSTTAGTTKYLREDGTWATPPDNNTTYSAMTGATSSVAGKAGLVPAPASGNQSKFLRGDGTWQTPTNTTYSVATTSANGLMSSSDKSKLDGIASGANAYSHPTSSGNKHIPSGGSSGQILRWSADGTAAWGADNNTTYGVVSTTADGLAPKRDGSTTKFLRADGTWAVPPDTNTTYNLGSFGVTATATELNYTDGVTSNIQTQLDNKLSLSGGGVTGTISAKSSQYAPVSTISTNCDLSGGMLKTSPGGNTEITYGVTITDPSSDGSRATINGYKIYHEGNLPTVFSSNIAVPHNTELVFGEKGTTNRGFIKSTSSSLVIKAPGSNITSNPQEVSNTSGADFGGAGLRFSYCSAGILPYSTLNSSYSMNLGSSTLKFGTIYSAASALNSDAKLKKNIESLSEESDKYLKTFDELNFVRFKWAQNMNGGLATPASSRYHLGLIAQELEKTLADNGINGGDTGAIQANFFADNTSEAWISGGYQIKKEGYDYSENVWNYKHGLEYEWINEVIEKDFYEFNNAGGYNVRPNIKYIMFEDISKVASEGNQPPLKVNSITLVDKNDEYIELELTENGISYYDHDNDTELKVPLSDAHLNEDGSLTINYNKMWATYMIEVPTFAFADYKTIIVDVDYIGEYKCYMIPEGNYKNANVWDRGNNDTILYDYSVNYNEIYALSLYALQESRKKYLEDKVKTDAIINELTEKVNLLLKKVGE